MRERLVLTESELRRIISGVAQESSGQRTPGMSAKPFEALKGLLKINDGLAPWGVRVGVGESKGGESREVSYAIDLGGERGPERLESAGALGYWLDEIAGLNRLGGGWVGDWERTLPWGAVTAWHLRECQSERGRGVWEVQKANAKRGWGVLLYEVSLELASQGDSGGLVSDRSSVTDEAMGVWSKYELSRGDVKKLQLDVDANVAEYYGLQQLTPQEWDDCYQGSAYDHAGEEWYESPLSKAYLKGTATVIPALKEADLLWTLAGP